MIMIERFDWFVKVSDRVIQCMSRVALFPPCPKALSLGPKKEVEAIVISADLTVLEIEPSFACNKGITSQTKLMIL